MANSVRHFLAGSDSLAALQTQVQRLRRLQQCLQQCLPPFLAPACYVANVRQDSLVLLAANGSVAAKLRQITPRLLQSLADQGSIFSEIQIQVSLQCHEMDAGTPVQPRSLGEPGKQSIARLCETLPADAPLRISLERLLRRSVCSDATPSKGEQAF